MWTDIGTALDGLEARWDQRRHIATGSLSEVWEAPVDGQLRAIKVPLDESWIIIGASKTRKFFRTEAEALADLKESKNVIDLHHHHGKSGGTGNGNVAKQWEGQTGTGVRCLAAKIVAISFKPITLASIVVGSV